MIEKHRSHKKELSVNEDRNFAFGQKTKLTTVKKSEELVKQRRKTRPCTVHKEIEVEANKTLGRPETFLLQGTS